MVEKDRDIGANDAAEVRVHKRRMPAQGQPVRPLHHAVLAAQLLQRRGAHSKLLRNLSAHLL
jgi:hypothetical protein